MMERDAVALGDVLMVCSIEGTLLGGFPIYFVLFLYGCLLFFDAVFFLFCFFCSLRL